MKKFFTLILSLGLLFCFIGCKEPGVPNPFPGTWINEEYGVKMVFTESTFTAYYKTSDETWDFERIIYNTDGDGDGEIDPNNPNDIEKTWILKDIKYESMNCNFNGFDTIEPYVSDYPSELLWIGYHIDKDGNLAGQHNDNEGNVIAEGNRIPLIKQ